MTVRDDGPDIPPMEVTVVEADQETPPEHATGLGLWLVNWTVTHYGGCFQFSVDDGTVATLRLPAIGAEQSVEDAARRRCYGSRSEPFVRPAVLPVGIGAWKPRAALPRPDGGPVSRRRGRNRPQRRPG